ncbi:hypothetical protein [Oscillatoria sp. HE19RPO]|uniref:hypothetical protein n=1 Tax=Oscillatoria sp. HE19RPO TaxID=2954806 RepID=UPI0020C55CA2|nr:hypothetical protein [Oscillatoria sp. HE19RPO]
MKFQDFIEFFPAAIQANSVNLNPEQLAEIVKLLEGLESQPESTRDALKVWIRNHPDVREAVINFAYQKDVNNTPEPDRENVNSPRRKQSSEVEILQNLFELRKQAKLQQDAPKNLPPQNN